MKNKFLVLILIILPLFSVSQTDTLLLHSKISNVTVFYTGAQVSRSVSININKGSYIFILKKLPFAINEQSIQVKGIPNCQILSVKKQISEISIKDRQPVIDAKKAIEEKEMKIQVLSSKLQVFEKEEKLLWDNRLLGKEDKGLSVIQLKEAADFYRLRLNEISTESFKLKNEIKTEHEKILEINKKINELNAEIEKQYSEILVSVNCEKTTNASLSFSYMIAFAGWIPYYDFRIEEITDPLAITYNANVFQSSGEDWNNVKIKLSGNEPLIKTAMPELRKWLLENNNNKIVKREIYSSSGSGLQGKITDESTKEPIPFANIIIEQNGNMISGTTSDFDGNYILKPIQPGIYQLKCSYVGYKTVIINNITVSKNVISFNNIKLKVNASNLESVNIVEHKISMLEKNNSGEVGIYGSEMRRIPGRSSDKDLNVYEKPELIETNFISNELQRNVSSMEYVIESPYTILSDGKDYAIKIKEVKKEVDFHYLSIPKVDTDPFLICNLINWQDLYLLDAKYNIFFKGTYVGESYINTYESSDTMRISLGRDKSLYVSRSEQKEINDKKMNEKEVKAITGYIINVKNTKNHPIHIIIEDQYPVTERKSIDIKLIDSGNAKISEQNGKLSWDIFLQPGEKKEIRFSYSVKYPRYIGVSND